MASNEGTSAASDVQSSAAAKKEEKPLFTTKEQNLMTIAMIHCLKSGAPEIDYSKFMKYGEFNTMKTAQNTWGKIKAKLKEAAGPSQEEDEEDAAPKTPKAKATPKKRGSAKKATTIAEDDDAEESPTKKVKKEDGGAGAEKELDDGEIKE